MTRFERFPSRGVPRDRSTRRVVRTVGVVVAAVASFLLAAHRADAQVSHPRVIDRGDYEDRLRAMWLGEVIGNWTGLPIENAYVGPPFLTDDAWGQVLAPGYPPLDFVFQDPWRADDDTDIEYVYLHALTTLNDTRLSGLQIADFWRAHVNHHIWISNAAARGLMERGVLPPGTSLGACNIFRTMIDAQLTTEFFGAMNPGMPAQALEMADLPIRTTAYGNAVHASQAYVVMYSLATLAPASLTPAERVLWLVRQARRFIPDSSKSADVCDFVLAEFLSNPDPDNWELTRDRIYDRYQLHAGDHGFFYRGWSESSINFATGIMSLLYGRGDFRRTIQIGTLAGWDCDNQPATLGGLLGLMLGYDALVAQFPGQPLSDRFTHTPTRDALPDLLPSDPAAEDTFTMMASRMADISQRCITAAGGIVNPLTRRWVLPPSIPLAANVDDSALLFNPGVRECMRSSNARVRADGGAVSAASTALPSNPPFVYPYDYGFSLVPRICNAEESDFSGVEANDWERVFYSTQGSGDPPGIELAFSVTYSRDVLVHTIRFIEGNHFDRADLQGGWLVSPRVQVLIGGQWVSPPGATLASLPPDPARPFQFIDWALATPMVARGVRLLGFPGGRDAFVTIAELDALTPPVDPPDVPVFDRDYNGRVDAVDFVSWLSRPVDLDGDGTVDQHDVDYFYLAVKTGKPTGKSIRAD
ncbi:MAG: ADP-ribosylglycohydrolase family protein [Phycisphaerales bacterium]